jgi:PBSX family phage terminase large subunit
MKQPTIKQTEALASKARFKVLNWGRRSGKTYNLGWEALGTALTINNAKITYYAQTHDDARDIAWDIFKEIFGESVIKTNETLLTLTIKNLKGGTSKIFLKGWESVVTANKGRGTENDLLLIDEVAFCRGFQDLYDKVLEPTILTTKGRVVFSSTPNGFNDFYSLSNFAQSHKDWFYSHATSYDNPFNDPEDLESIKERKTDDAFSQEYLADFRKLEGLVYKEFDRQWHIIGDKEEEKIDLDTYIGAVDFGYANPAGVVAVKKDKRGVYWVVDEYYEKGRTDAQVAEVVNAFNFTKVYPDPENQGAIKELKDRRVNICDVLKGKDSVKTGISKIRELLKQHRIKIHSRCVNFIWEMENYHYPKKNLEKNQDEAPVKKDDHLMDALRYIILMDAKTEEITDYDYFIRSLPNFITSEEEQNPAR